MQSDIEYVGILQESSLTNPVQEKRCPTNTRFIFVFYLIVLLWFAVGIQAFARGSPNKFDDVLINDEEDILFILYKCVNVTLPYISPPKETFGKVFLFSLFLGGISVFNCIILIKTFTRPFICISLLLAVIYLITELVSIVTLHLNLLLNISAMISFVYTITVLFCVSKVGLKMLCEMVKNSTRAIIDCPAIILFTCAAVILEILAVIFALNVLKIILSSNDGTFWMISFSLIIVSGGVVLCAFIILFTVAVISEYTVNWFWIEDKKEVSYSHVLDSIRRIFGNHLGTIALESTLIIPLVYGIINALKYRNTSCRARHIDETYVESIARVTLVSKIVHSTLIHTSIYGSDFVKATEKTFQIVVPNASLYLAATEIFNMMAVIGIIGNTVVMFFTAYLTVRIEHIHVSNMPLPFFWGFYFPTIAYCILMTSVGRALLANKMIILKAERDSEENPITHC